MISRCVKVSFPKILIFYLIYFKYGNSPISFWPWATDLVIIFLSGLFCTHFLLYKVWIDGSLFLLHLWTSQNPYLILLPLHLSGEIFTKLPTFFDTLTGLWKYHTTKLIQDTIKSTSNLKHWQFYQFSINNSCFSSPSSLFWNLWVFFQAVSGSPHMTSPFI